MRIRRIKTTKKNIDKVLELSKEFIEECRKSKKTETMVSVSTALKHIKEFYRKDLQYGKGAIFVAEDKGIFVGYIIVLTCVPEMEKMRKYSSGYINDLYVNKKYRGKNYGIKLIKEAEKWLKIKGKKEISLTVEASNKNAVNIYKKLKFKDKSIKMEKKL